MKNKLIKILIGSSLLLSYSAYAGKTHFNSSELVSKQSLSCNFQEAAIDYQDLNTALVKTTLQQKYLKNHILKVGNYTIDNVANFSNSRVKDKYGYLVSRNLDLNISKYGLIVMRFAQFEGEYSEGGTFGYYFILKGTPAFNKAILKQQKMYPDHADIESTQSGNTRIKCYTAG